jgi:hypothetical protein
VKLGLAKEEMMELEEVMEMASVKKLESRLDCEKGPVLVEH